MQKQKPKIKLNDGLSDFKSKFFWLRNKYLKYLLLGSLAVGTVAVSTVFFGEKEMPPDFQIQNIPIEEKYPRLANLFFKWDITNAEARELAKWDIVVIDMEAQIKTPEGLKLLKQYNPQIKILAYITSQEFTHNISLLQASEMRRRLHKNFSDTWWLKSAEGGRLVWWPGAWLINITDDAPTANGKRWNDYLPEFVAREILSSSYWDGVFYDNAWESVSWLPAGDDIDLNGDGRAEGTVVLDQKWRSGMQKILKKTEELAPGKIIMANGGKGYYSYLNGIAIEHFHRTDWTQAMNDYFFIQKNAKSPVIDILNSNTENTGKQDDYKKMRFGLTSTLLGDGYFSFDYGDQAHNQLWWYDEYGVFLGKPLNSAYNVQDFSTQVKAGLWRRDFQNGIVLVNSTNEKQTINLYEDFEKIHGQQDKSVNDGSIIQKITLNPYDGVILLRRAEKIVVSSFQNGSFTRVLDDKGKIKRAGFFTYEGKYEPNDDIVLVDLDNNGTIETIVAGKSKIEIWNQEGRKIVSFYPYAETYDKGINFAVGDVNHDGRLEIVTGAERGGGPHVRIFNWQGRLIHPGFFAYGKNFRGGVNVALGDLDGNGWPEIITGAGFGGGPHVRIFSGGGKLIHPGFFAYDPKFRGGVNVASSDFNGDGRAEIITGAGFTGGPHVKIFDGQELTLRAEFFAFDAKSRGGVKVGVDDLDKDGRAEILASTTDIYMTMINK